MVARQLAVTFDLASLAVGASSGDYRPPTAGSLVAGCPGPVLANECSIHNGNKQAPVIGIACETVDKAVEAAKPYRSTKKAAELSNARRGSHLPEARACLGGSEMRGDFATAVSAPERFSTRWKRNRKSPTSILNPRTSLDRVQASNAPNPGLQ